MHLLHLRTEKQKGSGLTPPRGFVCHGRHSKGTSFMEQLIDDVAVVTNPPANVGDARDPGSILELGRSLGKGNGTPL